MATDLELANELNTLIPVLKEREARGLIKASVRTSEDLVKWVVQNQRAYSDAQRALVARMLNRAKRRTRGGATVVTTQQTVVQQIDVDAVVEKVLEKVGNQKVDVEAVLQALEKRVPREVVVKVTKADGKTGTVKGPKHSQFEHLARAASVRLANGFAPGIFLQGEASSGKTTGCRQLAETMDLDWHFNGAISFPHEMLGFIDGAGKYHRTPFRDAYEKGGVYTFDEVDRSDPVALLAVNPHLANGVATFPDKQVRRHKDCVIVATANTWGLGASAEYSGATKLDAAFLSRFPVRINWDIDPVLEEAIVGSGPWLNRVRAARQRARAVGLKVMFDVRAAQAGAALIQGGYSLDEAANMTYLANLKPEQRKQVEGM